MRNRFANLAKTGRTGYGVSYTILLEQLILATSADVEIGQYVTVSGVSGVKMIVALACLVATIREAADRHGGERSGWPSAPRSSRRSARLTARHNPAARITR